MKKQNQAFTLVELIVVITILAILGTVAFISLQGYTREARDSKRLSDINNIQKKIGIEVVKGTSLSSLISFVKTNSGLTINSASGVSIQGTANFQALKEDGSKFKDPTTLGDYVLSYSVGGTGTGAYKFTQVSTINEENNQAVVNGNYYQMQVGDSIGIIKNDSNSFVINEGSNLPYEPVAGGGDGGGPVYSCNTATKPTDNGHITYIEGAINENQAYIQDALNCGYSCDDFYSDPNCETYTPPITSANCTSVGNILTASSIYGNCSGSDIIVCSGNGVGYTVAACNVGTDISGTGAASYGKYFQWGNNGGNFLGNIITSENQVNVSSYGPGNYYNDTTFIKVDDWTGGSNINLWGDTTNTSIARQGPCLTGYHVPSKSEWNSIITAGQWVNVVDVINMSNVLKLPKAGFIDYNDTTTIVAPERGLYWTTSTQGEFATYLNLWPGIVQPYTTEYHRGIANSVRCIKN